MPSSMAARSASRSPYGDDPEAGGERAEALPGQRVGGEADDGGGAAVEVAGRHDDVRLARGHALDVVAPLAGHLDRGLHRLRAGVHGQHPVHPGQRRQVPAERAELVVVEGPAGQGHPVELVAGRLQQHRVPVPEVESGVPRQAVEVAAAVHVGHPGALGLRDHHRQRVVVVRHVPAREAEVLLGAGGGRTAPRLRHRPHAPVVSRRTKPAQPAPAASTPSRAITAAAPAANGSAGT